MIQLSGQVVVATNISNGLPQLRRQAITWNNAGLLSIGPLGTHFSEIRIKIKAKLILENAAENVVCKMMAILSRGRRVNRHDIGFDICNIGAIITKSSEWLDVISINGYKNKGKLFPISVDLFWSQIVL